MTIPEFIAHNYYKDDTIDGERRVENLISHPGVYYYGTPDDGVMMVYLTLSDEGLDLLRSKKELSDFTPDFSAELLQYPGNHIYVFRLISEGAHRLSDLRKLRSKIMSKHHAVSFSWHDDHSVKLHTYELS